MKQAYYSASVGDFLSESSNSINGKLGMGVTEHPQMWTLQLTSWESSIELLKRELTTICDLNREALNWSVILEYEVPRLLSRIDVVLIALDVIFVIEFKFDRKFFELADQRQVEDYALDLKDFHFQSRERTIIPVLLAPDAPSIGQPIKKDIANQVQTTIKANRKNFAKLVSDAFEVNRGQSVINVKEWINSSYSPTPTIIQAAQALFAGQKVEAITNSGAANLTITMDHVINIIHEAQKNREKVVCFITGVPGAGKTLVGLNVIHKEQFKEENQSNAAYFSGNGPLVSVLREALTRDELGRNRFYQDGAKVSKSAIEKKVESKIQNLHQFIKDGVRSKIAPHEKIVVFDEAQRCWDASKFYNAAVQSRVKEDNPLKLSEAEIIFDIMDRHSDWAVIIALVGNGQEINTGEAGIGEWGKVIRDKHSHWKVHISPELVSGGRGNSVSKLYEKLPEAIEINPEECLHLSVSQRSFKANKLNNWVEAVIGNNPAAARELYGVIHHRYPIYITRQLDRAKAWLRSQKQGNKRIGLIASSGGLRLRGYGINTKEEINVPYWFLNDETDVRSSYYLEIVATEYKIQGLDIDWVGMCWDGDLRRNKGNWEFRKFSGTKWGSIHKDEDKQFLLNKYRVLLTRAREGMVIWIPLGDQEDETRSSSIYEPIYEYLKECGLKELY